MTEEFWQTKLHARLHDPAEKALVLLRDPAGHEGGTSKALHRLLGYQRLAVANLDPDNADVLHTALFKHGIPADIYDRVRRADWWAAAADRPQWPLQEISVQTSKGQELSLKVANWAQVRWTQRPVLIHPLTGTEFDLRSLGETEVEKLKSRSFEHFSALVLHSDAEPDAVHWSRTLLAFWRFGPSLDDADDDGSLGALWPLLPADTRVPDHSIWDHLDLTSAFAGAFTADPNGDVALLTVSLGPVQSFIEAARSTSDLWAGSHLLARLAWEAIKPVCEALGPDAVLFPRLRGVPQVDLWLRDDCHLPADWFKDCEWAQAGITDANPLYSAALPNRFVALVPQSKAKALALEAERAVRNWVQERGQEVVDRLLMAAGLKLDAEQHCHRQMREQLAGFPELHWAAVPFSLIRPRNVERQTDLDTSALSAAMAPFFGVAPGKPCGFLDTPAWEALRQESNWDDNTTFFAPNPGVLYPAVHDLAERALAAAKASRHFSPSTQQGWRCSLTGESEWLTTDRAQLSRSYREQTDTLWALVARHKRAWAKPGEHLGGLSALKRLWPSLFAEEVGRALSDDGRAVAQRFVVSTHAMALARPLEAWLSDGAPGADQLEQALAGQSDDRVALPRKLVRDHARHPHLDLAKRLPAVLDAADDLDDAAGAGNLARRVRQALSGSADGADTRIEAYYSLLMMDGDHMGRWLAGDEDRAISYRQSFHPQVQAGFEAHAVRQPLLRRYAQQKRALSPNRHLAISGALNDFSLHVARHVIELEHLGRLIYAGGDDVLAMLPVADLLPAMQRLRCAYSGDDPQHQAGDLSAALSLRQGYALLKQPRGSRRLLRMMGEKASASCGAVIAHHQAPLGAVLRELRHAERRAKGDGGRNAFSLSVVKRSGGALYLTAKWGEPVALLTALRDFLADDGVSRRAAYHSLQWLKDLPADQPSMLEALLAYQFDRQASDEARKTHQVAELSRRLVAVAFDPNLRPASADPLVWMANFISVAEFLARKTRSGE